MEESWSSFDVAFQAMREEREKTRQENEQLVDEELEKMKVNENDCNDIKCCCYRDSSNCALLLRDSVFLKWN